MRRKESTTLIVIVFGMMMVCGSRAASLYAPALNYEGDGYGIGLYAQRLQEGKAKGVVPYFGSYGRERAILESESKLSKIDSAYTKSHSFIAGIVGHQALIDTLSEDEKYGNDGAVGRSIATVLIRGFDGIANIVNSVIETPKEKTRYASKTATSALNALGAKLVGL